MDSLKSVMEALEGYGDPTIKNIYLNHGAREPLFGVRVQDMKKIVKKVKKNHELSLALYATGNSDAMYLAGLLADEKKISRKELQEWVVAAYYYGISEYTVAWVAAESAYGYELGLEWITSRDEHIAACGWSTLSNYCALKPDKELDIEKFSGLLDIIASDIHNAADRVRYTMNGFVIAVGCYIIELSDKALQAANHIGKVKVNMGKTACKVPLATTYIEKVKNKGRLGKKRKHARC